MPDGSQLLKIAHGGRAHAVSFSPNGHFLATVSYDDTVLVWEIPVGRVAARLVVGGAAYNVSFSPDGSLLGTSAHSNTGEIWDWQKGREIARIINPRGNVSKIAFSQSGRTFATGGQESDPGVDLWQLPEALSARTEHLDQDACRRLRQNLTPSDWKSAFGAEPYRKTCPNLPIGTEPLSEEKINKAADDDSEEQAEESSDRVGQ